MARLGKVQDRGERRSPATKPGPAPAVTARWELKGRERAAEEETAASVRDRSKSDAMNGESDQCVSRAGPGLEDESSIRRLKSQCKMKGHGLREPTPL